MLNSCIFLFSWAPFSQSRSSTTSGLRGRSTGLVGSGLSKLAQAQGKIHSCLQTMEQSAEPL